MRLTIHIKPNSKKVGIEIVSENVWIVRVRERPIEGKANEAMIEAIAEKLNMPKSRLKLISGEKSKHKIVEVTDWKKDIHE